MKIRAIVLLGTIAVVCLLLLTLQMRGYTALATDALAVVTTPIQSALARVNRSAVGVWSTYQDWKNVRAENRRLREEAQQLRVEALQVTETVEENRRLRRLLALKAAMPLETLSGEIIAREWGGWVRSLTVNRDQRYPYITAMWNELLRIVMSGTGPSADRARATFRLPG